MEDVTTEADEKHWSAYLQSGRSELKVAELANIVQEFSEEDVAHLNNVIAVMDKDLQAPGLDASLLAGWNPA